MVGVRRAGGPAASLSALIVIAVLIVLLLGGDRLSALGRGLGEGVRGYRKARRAGDLPKTPQPPQVVESPPKLLPAKGESSAPRDEEN
jgi:TatA/E family protein of Tat protein translocase